MLTVNDILQEIAPHVRGAGINVECGDEESREKAESIFNEAQRLLMKRGEFAHTERDVCLLACDGCLTLDRRILKVTAFTMGGRCGERFGQVRDDFFRYHPSGPGNVSAYNQCATMLEDMGDGWPTMQEIPSGYPMHIAAWSDRPEEEGATLTIGGVDVYGREVSRHTAEGKGFTLPIKERFVEQHSYTGDDSHSSGMLTKISSLTKPRTKGYVYVYGYHPIYNEDGEFLDHKEIWLATLAPDETNACHRRYKVPGAEGGCCQQINARVSLRNVKQYGNDIALLQDVDAFILMTRAIAAREASNYAEYSELAAAAVGELMLEHRKSSSQNGRVLNIAYNRSGGAMIRNGSSRYY